MPTVASILSDPARRAAVRAFWVAAPLPSLASAEQLLDLAAGGPQTPGERSYVFDPGPPALHRWEIRVNYPLGAGEVTGLILLSGEGEVVAAGGGPDRWGEDQSNGAAFVTLTCQEGTA